LNSFLLYHFSCIPDLPALFISVAFNSDSSCRFCLISSNSFRSMHQLPELDSFVVLTEKVKASAMEAVANELGAKSWAKQVPFWMPCASEPDSSR